MRLRCRARPGRAFSVIAAASCAAVLGVASCTGSTPTAPGAGAWPSPSGTGVVTVTILSGTDTSQSAGDQPLRPGESGMYSELVDWWNANEAPRTHIRVVLDTVAGGATEAHSEMLGDAQAGNAAYDIYNLDNEWVPEFAAGHYIRPLTGHLDSGGFLDRPLASGTYQGQLFALPFTTDAGLLYYRTDLVSKAQLGQLTSFASLVRLARQDMNSKAGPGPAATIGYAGQFAGYEGLTVNLLELIHAADQNAFRADGTIRDTDAVTQALTELSGALGSVIPYSELSGFDETQATSEFSAGHAVFMRNWPIYYQQLVTAKGQGASQVSGHVGVAPLPFPSVLGGQDLAVAQASPNPAAAVQVIQYLTSLPAEQCLFAVAGFPATRDGAYASGRALPDGYDDGQGSPVHGKPLCGRQAGQSVTIGKDIEAAVNHAFLRPRTPYYTEFSSLIQEQVPKLQQGRASVLSVISSLAGALNAAATGHAPS